MSPVLLTYVFLAQPFAKTLTDDDVRLKKSVLVNVAAPAPLPPHVVSIRDRSSVQTTAVTTYD